MDAVFPVVEHKILVVQPVKAEWLEAWVRVVVVVSTMMPAVVVATTAEVVVMPSAVAAAAVILAVYAMVRPLRVVDRDMGR